MSLRLLVVLGSTGCGIGIGARTGHGVATSSKPAQLVSAIDETEMTMADASNSQSWLELEVHSILGKYVRAMFVIGGGNGHTRFREIDNGPIYAKDDNFHARLGGGVAVRSPLYKSFRLAPYILYNNNFGISDNTASSTREIGLDLELVSKWSSKSWSTFVIGAALISESGNAYADLGGFSSAEGPFEVSGAMVTFGWHYSVMLKED